MSLQLDAQLRICLQVLASHYPGHVIDLNQSLQDITFPTRAGWTVQNLLAFVQASKPELLAERALLRSDEAGTAIYFPDRSEEAPVLFVYDRGQIPEAHDEQRHRQQSPLKIAHIAPPWLPVPPTTYGGTERIIADLVEEQVAQGHDVTLFAPADAQTSARLVSFIPASLRSQEVPWAAHLQAYYHLHQAVEAARAANVDIVHSHLSSAADLYLLPLTSCLEIAHVTTLHSAFPFDRVQEWKGTADDYYLRQWAASVPIVAISEQARRQAPPELQVIDVVHHGIALQQYVPNGEPRGGYLAWVGRFVPEKGPHLAIAAARRAGMPLILAGTIDEGMEESRRYFHTVIEPQLDHQVHYIGPVTQSQKVALLSGADGLLNPIEWEEPFGLVMVEAMALGCPVIAFARGAAPEVLLHEQTGYLVSGVDEMIEYIPHLARIDRQFTRTYVDERFSACAMARNYVKVYRRLLHATDLQ